MKNNLKLISIIISLVILVTLVSCGKDDIEVIGQWAEEIEYTHNQEDKDEKIKQLVKDQYSLENPFIEVNPYGNSPLSAIVVFHTDNKEEITFTVKGKDESVDVSMTLPASKDHVIPVFGLYSGVVNDVELRSSSGITKTISISTDAIDDMYISTDYKLEGTVNSDWVFVSPKANSKENLVHALAYDKNGDVRWAFKGEDSTTSFVKKSSSSGRFLLSSPKKYNDFNTSTGVIEIDLVGKIYNEYLIPGGQRGEIYEDSNGDFWVISNSIDNSAINNVIYKIQRKTGKILKSVYMNELFSNTQEGHSLEATNYDWAGVNSVIDIEDQKLLLVSAGKMNAVMAISLEKRTPIIKWIFGDYEGWSEEYGKYFFDEPIDTDFVWSYGQHSIKLTSENNLLMFDNGNSRAKSTNIEDTIEDEYNHSRAVVYNINENNMSFTQEWQHGAEKLKDWYSSMGSSVQQLSPTGFLFDSGYIVKDIKKGTYISNICEVYTAENADVTQTVLSFNLKYPTHSAYKFSPIDTNMFDYKAKYKLRGKQVDAKYEKTNFSIEKYKDVDERNEIEVTQDENRIVISGKLKNEHLKAIPKVILKEYNANKAVYSNIYSFDDLEIDMVKRNKFTKSISSKGLKGAYMVFLSLSGKEYYTGYSVYYQK